MAASLRKIIGPNIRKHRMALNMPQSCLAKATNVKQQTVSKWEHGVICVRAEHVLTIAKKLGVPVGVLYGEGE